MTDTAPSGVPTAVTMLLKEHEIGRGFLDPMEELSTAVAGFSADGVAAVLRVVETALSYLEDELEEHIEKEEEAFFPPFRGRLPDVDSALIDEFLAEHDQIRLHRDDLQSTLMALLDAHDDVRRDCAMLRQAMDRYAAAPNHAALSEIAARAKKTAAIALIHFENEENLLFPLAPRLLTSAELETAASCIEAIGERCGMARNQRDGE